MKQLHRFINLLALTGLLTISCNKDTCIHGDGPIVAKEVDIELFSALDLNGSLNIVLIQGNEQKVIAKGQENIISYLSTEVDEGNWTIKMQQGCYNDYELTLEITTPSLEEFGTSGTGNIQLTNNFEGIENINVFNSGSGQIFGNDSLYISNLLFVTISGSGGISLNGICENQNISVSGSGSYNSYGLASTNCVISLPGSGDCYVNVNSSLDVFISGSGNVYYTGDPDITSTITGSGQLINEN